MDVQTYCIYCQKEFKTPRRLRVHIEKIHKGSYADYNVNLQWKTVQVYPEDIH